MDFTQSITALVSALGGAGFVRLLISRHLKRMDEIEKRINTIHEVRDEIHDIHQAIALMQKDFSNLSRHLDTMVKDHEKLIKLELLITRNTEEIADLKRKCKHSPSLQ